MNRRRILPLTITAAALAALLTAAALGAHAELATKPPATLSHTAPAQSPTPAAAAGTETPNASELLAALPVKGSAPMTGYDRAAHFGSSWIDVDNNACSTRDDILQRDLTDTTLENSCTVLSGTLIEDPYTGATIPFTRGPDTSHLIQIDHIVALGDAWRTGAQQLTQQQREALANDPLNLIAVDGTANAQKQDSNAASWLPANRDYRCEYVTRQVQVKTAHNLWVVPAERDAIAHILTTCTDDNPNPSPPTSSSTPTPVITSCAQARKAGIAPIHHDHPAYAPTLDGDSDGIACE